VELEFGGEETGKKLLGVWGQVRVTSDSLGASGGKLAPDEVRTPVSPKTGESRESAVAKGPPARFDEQRRGILELGGLHEERCNCGGATWCASYKPVGSKE